MKLEARFNHKRGTFNQHPKTIYTIDNILILPY